MLGRDRIQYKTPDQVQLMRLAGLIVADALDAVRAALAPGLTTADLDRIANELIVGRGATPSFLNYGTRPTRRRSASRSTKRSCTASRAGVCCAPVTW